MNVLFLVDNREVYNWGGRSTSIALKELISSHNNITHTIYGQYTARYDPFVLRDKIYSFSDRFRMALCRRNIWKEYLIQTDPYNIIKDNIEDSYLAYKKMMSKSPLSFYKNLDEKLKSCDALVCNGEGTMIFSTPSRYSCICRSLIIKLAQEYGKKTYLLNAMFSDCPVTGRNEKTLAECRDIFTKCTMVTARDPISYDYYKQYIGENVSYVPDALFTWEKYSEYIPLAKKNHKAFVSHPEYDEKFDLFDFSKPYICLSGSSLAAWNQAEAQKTFTRLAASLKKDFRVFIVPTCAGDQFLHQVALDTNCPLIPVGTNIFMGMSILANAEIFVSGRWHPSILASLGGTPCVFLGSNSHKTKAIQEMLEYPNIKEYSAIPSQEDIECIINDCKKILSNKKNERERIIATVHKLSVAASNNAILY